MKYTKISVLMAICVVFGFLSCSQQNSEADEKIKEEILADEMEAEQLDSKTDNLKESADKSSKEDSTLIEGLELLGRHIIN